MRIYITISAIFIFYLSVLNLTCAIYLVENLDAKDIFINGIIFFNSTAIAILLFIVFIIMLIKNRYLNWRETFTKKELLAAAIVAIGYFLLILAFSYSWFHSDWVVFQNSGALMTAFFILSGMLALYRGGEQQPEPNLVEIYKARKSQFIIMEGVLGILATLIWGFGQHACLIFNQCVIPT